VRYIQGRSSAVPPGETQARIRMGNHQPSATPPKQSDGNSCQLGLCPE
jgi:hypothetical protein